MNISRQESANFFYKELDSKCQTTTTAQQYLNSADSKEVAQTRTRKECGHVLKEVYLWTRKYVFHIIFTLLKNAILLWIFVQTLKSGKANLNLQAVQTQMAGQIWLSGCSLSIPGLQTLNGRNLS